MRIAVTRVLGSFCVATAILLPTFPLAALVEPERLPAAAEKSFGMPSSTFPPCTSRGLAEEFLAPLEVTGEWGEVELVWLPMASGKDSGEVDLGNGYGYRLVWSVKVKVAEDPGNWELLVDAATGEILACEDQFVYAEARGGVYPVTNDGIDPDGIEQPGWPMLFLSVTGGAGGTTDTGGNVNLTGSITASLSGPYVRMADNCGPISLTQSGGLDFGSSAGTDCATPGFGGAGNTHSSRSGFYELNKIKEMARGQLPANSWLSQQLSANMNETWLNCNAAWDPASGTVNFFRAASNCSNSGEIAGVFDHEWGHGLDDNDVDGAIASPSGEGIADVYAALRLDQSCIGRNFRSTNCTGYGDPCLGCTGLRDIDYLKRQSGQPHTFTWSTAIAPGCIAGVRSMPKRCGRCGKESSLRRRSACRRRPPTSWSPG